MRISIAVETFATQGLESKIMDLLSLLARGRHVLVLDDLDVSSQLREFLETHLAGALYADYLELIEKFEVEASWSTETATVVVKPESIDDLLHDLGEPGRVVVEDAVSDGAFIRGLTRALAMERIGTAIELGHLVVEHSGGKGRVEDIVRAKRKRYRLTPGVIGLIDSDRLVPDTRTSSHDLADRMDVELGVYVHVLEFREAENYVPNRCIAGLHWGRKHYLRLAALKELAPQQRGYFDMKKGFRSGVDGTPQLAEEQQPLYASVPASALRTLCTGFGDGLLNEFETQSAALAEADFRSLGPDVIGELRGFMDALSDLI